LFLTTNRVKAFDPAFQSRIHLSLKYEELSSAMRALIWTAFLEKARATGLGVASLAPEELQVISEKVLNGRQIKNAVKLAIALASYQREALSFGHVVRVIDVTMDGLDG
jgi:hypothetical protein